MNLLFLCVANSARSQMAEGLAKKIFGKKVNIYSAGSRPSGKVHSLAIQVMDEIGIDISKQTSKAYEDLSFEVRTSLDYVITLCAEETCPIVDSKAKKLHWPLPDPATSSDMLDDFRRTRDEIQKKLEELRFSLNLH